jgi:hypothetical protein
MMSVPKDIQLLHRSVVGCPHLKWIVSGKPVVALFPSLGQARYTDSDRCFLGKPSADESFRNSLRLWIGFDEESNKLLVTLTQRIRMTRVKKHRLFFLCLPTDSLKLDVDDPAMWLLSDHTVPKELLKDVARKQPQGQKSRLLRLGFKIETNKSWVIMPQYPSTGKLSSDAASTLRKLKTLSEASAFDLFTSHDSWIQQALLKAECLLKKKDGISCPKIQYSRFYPEGRAATTGCWELQGLHDASDDTEEDNNYAKSRLLKRKRDHAAPPPYETEPFAPRIGLGPEGPVIENRCRQKGPTLPLTIDTHTITHATDVSLEYANTSEIDDRLLGYVMRSSSPEAHAIVERVEPSSVNATGPVYVEARPTACGRHSSHRRQCVSVTARDVVSSATLATPFVFSDKCLPASAFVPSTPDAHGLSSTHPHDADISTSCVPETPVNVAASHVSPAIATNSIRCIPTQQVPLVLCSQNVVAWLVELWKRWPYAHYTCITQLLLIGGALDNMNVDSYHVARARTLATLLDNQTTTQSAQLAARPDWPHTSNDLIEDEIFELISWLTILDPDGDMIFCGQLNELAVIKKMTQGAAGSEREGIKSYHDTSSLFKRSKARIVLSACTRFGGTVLDQDKFIACKMRSERDRIGH